MGINAYIILIILSLCGPTLSTILRETHGVALKDNIEEEDIK